MSQKYRKNIAKSLADLLGSKSIPEPIERLLGEFEWPIELAGDATEGTYTIVSNALERTHRICVAPGLKDRALHIMHELTHALLAEKVNVLFATAYFAGGVEEARASVAGAMVRVAQDWFVEYEQFRRAPSWMLRELRRDIRLLNRTRDMPVQKAFTSALALKAGMGRPLFKQGNSPRELEEIFLLHDPATPTVEQLVGLSNHLLEAAGTEVRLQLSHVGGRDVLDVVADGGSP